MSYTYTSWRTALASAIVVDQNDPDFDGILPSCIDYAEQRIYSELDLLTTVLRASAHLAVAADVVTDAWMAFPEVQAVAVINLLAAARRQSASLPVRFGRCRKNREDAIAASARASA
jgi:hypothetical protein